MKLLTDIRNYPQSSGTSQAQRHKPDLQGAGVQLDERTVVDFILFVQRLSEQISYYNLNNVKQGNWSGFLQNDITYHLAEAAAGKPDQWQKVWNELLENTEGINGTPATDEDYQRYFTWRFSFLYTLISRLMKAYSYSSLLTAWRTDLQALYTSSHLMTLYFLLEKYYQASEPLLLSDTGTFSYNDVQLFSRQTVASELLQYSSDITSLLQENAPFITDAAFIFGTAVTIPEKVTAASEYLDEIAAQLIGLQKNVRLMAANYLSQTLDNYKLHQPHAGLLYAFLKLIEEHKNEINGLLLKHLDFYYKEVLLVKPKNWQPAKAFVTVELAKNAEDTFLPAGSLLEAGKDAAGKDVFYQTLQDITVTKTSVADIRSFTFLKNNSVTDTNVRSRLGMYSSSVANSTNGKGAALAPGQSWNAFSNEADRYQQIGLTFYSELLQQANDVNGRTFEIHLQLQNNATHAKAAAFINQYGSFRINTDKEPQTFHVSAIAEGSGIKISFTVSGIKNISKASPNASLIFGHKLESVVAPTMDVIEMFQTERIVNLLFLISNYTVKVNNVETAAGSLDISSAFPAFGGVPKTGSTFSVFSPLVLHKTIPSLSLIIHWATHTERAFTMDLSFAGKTIKGKVADNESKTTLPLVTVNETAVASNSDVITLTLTSNNFGHDTYAAQMTAAVLKYQDKDNNDNNGQVNVLIEMQKYINQHGINNYQQNVQQVSNVFNPPPVPYTPMIKSLELTGTFQENILANAAQQPLYNQYPFGIKKIYSNSPAYLIPTFPLTVQRYNSFSEGELYIGLKNAMPGQRVQLLIAVEEGSANPVLQNPQVSWAYLSGDGWNSLENLNLDDGTKNLIQSGIVSFQLPHSNILTHQILPDGMCWIKAAVPYNQSSAVASILSIQAQAVLSEFTNRNNDSAYPGTNIPANTITNLFPKQAAIKKVMQPYPSFGGQQVETAEKLYIRTSERLRHKGRSITAWDYENIVLEQFEDIYKVKVLQHACPYAGTNAATQKIVAKAGSVLVLAIPKTHAQNNLYKPLVSKAKLTEIYNFLRPLSSPFTQLTVMNPLFETISLSLNAYFMISIKDKDVYEQKLREDVQRFLSPWAFDSGAEPAFGGVLYRNAIVDFVEALSYVDYVQHISISSSATSGASPDSVQASSPASVLISGSMSNVKGFLQIPSNQNINTPSIAWC